MRQSRKEVKKLNIKKIAKELYRKDLKKQVDFKTVREHLNGIGYTVTFYDENKPLDVLKEYRLAEYCRQCSGLTLRDDDTKIVFINKKLSAHEMLYAILHETAHITLGHLDVEPIYSDGCLQDIQAEAFCYEVLKKAYKV